MATLFDRVFSGPSNVIEEENPYSDDEFEDEHDSDTIIKLKKKLKI